MQPVGVFSWRASRLPTGAAIPCLAEQIAAVQSSRLSNLRSFSPSPIESSVTATLCLKIAPRPLLLPRTAERPGAERTHVSPIKRGVGGGNVRRGRLLKHGTANALMRRTPLTLRVVNSEVRSSGEREEGGGGLMPGAYLSTAIISMTNPLHSPATAAAPPPTTTLCPSNSQPV